MVPSDAHVNIYVPTPRNTTEVRKNNIRERPISQATIPIPPKVLLNANESTKNIDTTKNSVSIIKGIVSKNINKKVEIITVSIASTIVAIVIVIMLIVAIITNRMVDTMNVAMRLGIKFHMNCSGWVNSHKGQIPMFNKVFVLSSQYQLNGNRFQ
jgi:hypothetical protein